jgi:hypothetical protein
MTNCNYTAELEISPNTDYTRRRKRGARAFIDSTLVDCSTEVYHENELYNVEWKSKAWSKLSSWATRLTAKALREKLELSNNVSVTFSAYAGCSCPCSPGYIIRAKNGQGAAEIQSKGLAGGASVYGKITFNEDYLAAFVQRRTIFNTEFLAECCAHDKVELE